jgi:hypothetical protein
MTKASAVTRGVGDSADVAGKRARSGFDLAGKGALLLGGAAAGSVIGLKSTIGAASDLNETLNKSRRIFGSSASEIEKWSRGSAKNFGLSQGAALDAAA